MHFYQSLQSCAEIASGCWNTAEHWYFKTKNPEIFSWKLILIGKYLNVMWFMLYKATSMVPFGNKW